MTIFLCRHGETTGDLEDRYGGDYEDSLTEHGKNQAREIAKKIVNEGVEVIYSSPRLRAQEAAKVISEYIGVYVDGVNDLRERNHYGILTGLVKAEAKLKFPEEAEKVKSYLTEAKGGENYEDFKKRVFNAWNLITSSNHKTVAVVTHGGVIRVIFRELLQLGEVDLTMNCLARIDFDGEKLTPVLLDGITKANV